jgi:hypothetical protein
MIYIQTDSLKLPVVALSLVVLEVLAAAGGVGVALFFGVTVNSKKKCECTVKL